MLCVYVHTRAGELLQCSDLLSLHHLYAEPWGHAEARALPLACHSSGNVHILLVPLPFQTPRRMLDLSKYPMAISFPAFS